jgi:hypothetical protein
MTTQKKLFVAFSHTLTADQISDAKASLGIEVIKTIQESFPDQHKKMVAIPAQWKTKQVKDLAEEIVSSAIQMGSTHIYVAGEPVLAYYAMTAAITLGLVVVQSTTERVSSEALQPDGTVVKTAVFKHVQWRVLD